MISVPGERACLYMYIYHVCSVNSGNAAEEPLVKSNLIALLSQSRTRPPGAVILVAVRVLSISLTPINREQEDPPSLPPVYSARFHALSVTEIRMWPYNIHTHIRARAVNQRKKPFGKKEYREELSLPRTFRTLDLITDKKIFFRYRARRRRHIFCM